VKGTLSVGGRKNSWESKISFKNEWQNQRKAGRQGEEFGQRAFGGGLKWASFHEKGLGSKEMEKERSLRKKRGKAMEKCK